jgi:hypothetical protein
MSLHKLTPGSGYDYLTRQVAALDATEKGHVGLAAYYTEQSESPGVWVGSGLSGVDGLQVGDPVSAEQMRALFGCGMHPLAEARLQQLDGSNLTRRDFENVMRLGVPFRNLDETSAFRVEVAKRIADLNAAVGEPADAAAAAADRARIRHRGGPGVLPRRARPGSGRCPGVGRSDRQGFTAPCPDCRRV